MEVEVVSRKLIKPSNPTPNHLQKLGLSLFDQLAPPMYYSVIFYYSGRDENTAKIKAERCAQLEKSLSDALSFFFLLAGRFIQDDVSVDCSDQGVEYVEAHVNRKLADFIQEGPRIELLDELLPWDSPPPAKSATSPLLGIQINIFDCGGIVIGTNISHLIADASSMSTFISTWATASQDGVAGVLSRSSNFIHEIASFFPARISSAAKLPIPPVPKPTQHVNKEAKIVTKRFKFDQTIIASIKESAIKGAEGGPVVEDINASKVVVALALLWKAFMGLAIAKHGYLRDSVLVVAMNLRGKLSLKISNQSFGNFCIPVIVPFEANKDNMGLHDLMILLGDMIKNTSTKVNKASSIEDVATILIDSRRELTEKRDLTDGLDVYLCSSWCWFPLYEADFGWGKPFWVSVSTQPGQGVWLMDANDGDGIEVWVSLKEEDMVQFKRDPDILASLSKQF